MVPNINGDSVASKIHLIFCTLGQALRLFAKRRCNYMINSRIDGLHSCVESLIV